MREDKVRWGVAGAGRKRLFETGCSRKGPLTRRFKQKSEGRGDWTYLGKIILGRKEGWCKVRAEHIQGRLRGTCGWSRSGRWRSDRWAPSGCGFKYGSSHREKGTVLKNTI